jgi:hypothetical protein
VKRWFSGDERTLGLFLASGVLTMAFFRLDILRGYLGVGTAPQGVLLVAATVAWWLLMSRSFVWFNPAELTWRDFGAIDRVTLVARRLTYGWIIRQLALGYLLALLAALLAVPVSWVLACAAVLVGAGVLAFGVARRPPARWEFAVVLAVAVFAVVVSPEAVGLFVLAAGLAGGGLLLGRPPRQDATRQALVDGWRDRVLRVSGVQFLDLALLLPAARPVRPSPLTNGLRLAWHGVRGRARHVPTAVLLGLAAVAAHRTFPVLPEVVLLAVFGYLALVPLTAGLGELWRSPGRRRWVGLTDTALRWHHFLVATALAAVWALPVCLLGGWDLNVLVAVPVLSACAVRTMTRKAPTYDNLVPVDTPMGAVPARLIMQTLRGPDAGALAVAIIAGTPLWGTAVVVAAVGALAVFR